MKLNKCALVPILIAVLAASPYAAAATAPVEQTVALTPVWTRGGDEDDVFFGDIQQVIGAMGPMPGALEFLDGLRARFQVFILSDTFYEFADPLMRQLGRPTLLCHRLVVDEAGFVRDYKLRQPDQKRMAVNALKGLNYRVMAAGDSYNDTGMLQAADAGFFIHPPESIVAQFPQFPVSRSYEELKVLIHQAAARLAA